MRKYGLIGKNISYSFSRGYFQEKFQREHISASYENFDLSDLSQFPEMLRNNPELAGLNVTIPYKEDICAFLDHMDPVAAKIGAVNTIHISKEGELKGYNTDHIGFREAIRPFLLPADKKALILGTGGASKAIDYALGELGIEVKFVSRTSSENVLSYEELELNHLETHQVIVNCTPLGTTPNTSEYPPIPVQFVGSQHLVFDLIYNPPLTRFLSMARQQGARVSNGQKMLEFQAESAWKIWNSEGL